MKIDYVYLKRMLNAIIEKQSDVVDLYTLFDEIGADERLDKEESRMKFYGHLRLLKDSFVIEELFGKNLGVSYNMNGKMMISGCYIRLTAKGYDLAEMLNKNGVMDKLKKMTLSSAVSIASMIAEKTVEKVIDNFM